MGEGLGRFTPGLHLRKFELVRLAFFGVFHPVGGQEVILHGCHHVVRVLMAHQEGNQAAVVELPGRDLQGLVLILSALFFWEDDVEVDGVDLLPEGVERRLHQRGRGSTRFLHGIVLK